MKIEMENKWILKKRKKNRNQQTAVHTNDAQITFLALRIYKVSTEYSIQHIMVVLYCRWHIQLELIENSDEPDVLTWEICVFSKTESKTKQNKFHGIECPPSNEPCGQTSEACASAAKAKQYLASSCLKIIKLNCISFWLYMNRLFSAQQVFFNGFFILFPFHRIFCVLFLFCFWEC